MKSFKQLTALFLAISMALSALPVSAAAEETGLCDHHMEHLDCGYSAAVPGADCSHIHRDDCYVQQAECTLTHEEEPEGCSEESGCVTWVLQCAHAHDTECGYQQASVEQPCGFVCRDCEYQSQMYELPDTVTEPYQDMDQEKPGLFAENLMQQNAAAYGATMTQQESTEDPTQMTVISGSWEYSLLSDGARISAYTGTSSTVIIPSDLDDHPVVEIALCAFDGNTTMKSVIIPESVERIGDNAFRDCTKLASVIVQGNPAFDAYAFSGCSGLTSVDLGTITDIPEGMFYNCAALAEIAFADTIVSIGENAFFGCGLTSVELPENLTFLDRYAFSECPLISVTLPAKTRIAPNALGSCAQLAVISVDAGSNLYKSVDGVLYSADGTKLVAYPRAKTDETYIIPQGVTTICEAAFQGYASDDLYGSMLHLRNVYVPLSLEAIEENAYLSDTALNLYFCGNAPAGISSFSQSTKYYTPGMTGWNSDDATMLLWADGEHADQRGELYPPTCGEDGYTLDFCSRCNFTYRNTENGAKATGAHSWSVWAEASDTSHSRTCEGCRQEETADHNWDEGTYDPAPTPNADGVIRYSCTDCGVSRSETAEKLSLSGSCGTNLTWTFTDGLVTVTGTGAMTNYAEKEAPWSVYADCVLQLKLEAGVTTIGSHAFSGCENLTQLEIPGSVTSIGAAAFADGSSLSHIRFMGAAPAIAEDAFAGVSAQAFYAADRGNWSEQTLIGYGGSLEWTTFCNDGHIVVVDAAVAHTCFESGLTEGSHCSVCAEILVAQEVVPAAHDYNEMGECRACGLVTGSCGAGLIWNLEEGVLTISGEGAMTEFASANVQPWKNYRSRIVTVVLEGGVTSIGKYAFYGCSKLEAVTGGAGVKTIGNYAFYNCGSLAQISMPDSLEQIGEFAFYHCIGLTELELPAGVHTIGAAAFMSCQNLQSIALPEYCENLGSMAFYDCRSLTGVQLPEKLTTLTEQLFGECIGLTTINIPAAVTQIDGAVFAGCTGLTEVQFSGNAPSFAEDAFADWTATVLYPAADRSWDYLRADYGGTPTWKPYGSSYGSCGENVNWSFSESSGLLYFTGSGSMYDYYLPETDEVVTPWRHLIDQVTSVDVNRNYNTSILSVPDYYFRGYPNLKTVDLEKVVELGEGAFQNCPQLTSVTMDSLAGISDNAFSGCTALNRPVLPYSVKTIGQNAFGGCTALDEIILPGGITQIGKHAFRDCANLQSIRFDGEAPEIAEDAFAGVTAEALYLKDKTSWTEDLCQSYGGQLTWKQQGISGSCGQNLNWHFDEETGTLTISGTGAMTDYTSSYRAPWFINRAFITSLVLEEGITAIGAYAFSGCNAITSLELPEGITAIGKYAFYECSALTTVTLPVSLTTIGNYAFNYCSRISRLNISDLSAWCAIETGGTSSSPIFYATGLYLGEEKITQLEIPDTVARIGSYAFDGYEALTSVSIPENVEEIGEGAFYRCTGLKTVELSEGLQTISKYAFYDAGLTAVTIPAGVQSIGNNAFYSNALTTVTFEGAVQTIQNGAFSSNSSLTQVNASSISDWCATGFADASANPAYQAKSLYVDGSKITSLTIPEGVASIGAYCFYGNTAITQVTIPASVKTIGTDAFYNCTLTRVTVKDLAAWCEIAFGGSAANPLYKGAALYHNSTKITKLTIPSGATTISDYAFYNTSGITSVSVPDTVTQIGNYAFYDCESIAGISLPDSVTQIGNNAFFFCKGLTSLTIPGSVQTLGTSAFNGCSALTSLVLQDGLQEIGNNAFADCTKLTSLSIPGSVRSVGSNAFIGCTGVTELTIGNGVETLASRAFYGCTALTTVSIPASMQTIGSEAFWNCSGLTGVYVTDLSAWASVSFGNYSANPLYYAKKLYLNNQTVTSVVISEGTEKIDAYAFYNCTGLTSVTIPVSVKSIGRDAFYGCSNLKYLYISDIAAWCGIDFGSEYANPLYYADYFYVNNSYTSNVTIPQNIREIKDYAFCGSNLHRVNLPDTIKKIGKYAFYNCSNLSGMTLPEGLESIGDYAFRNDTGLREITIPSTVRAIGSNAFYPCASLKTVRLPSLEDWCSITFGSSHGIFTNATSVYVDGKLTTQLTIPEGLDKVPAYAFTNCKVLTSAVIPEGVQSLGTGAFDGCTALTSVSLPSTLNAISSYAFRNCSELESISVPAQVSEIGSYAFYGCSALTSVIIPENVTSIPTYTFYNCSALTEMIIPAAVTSIDGYAFQGCSGLRIIRFRGNAPSIATAFNSVTAVVYYPVEGSGWDTAVNSHYGGNLTWLAYSTDTTIPQGSCSDTISWVIQDGVLVLTGSGAMPNYSSTGAPWYSYRSAVGKVKILGDIDYIGAYNFYGCSALEEVTFTDNMPEFSSSAFAGVSALARYQAKDYTWDPDLLGNFGGTIRWKPIGQSEEYIAKGTDWVLDYDGTLTYSGWSMSDFSTGNAPWYPYRMHLKKLVINGSTTEIADSAFYGCSKLRTVLLNHRVYNVGSFAFAYCTALEKIFLPDYSTLTVGEHAFYQCTALQQLALPSSCSIGAYAFSGCSSLSKIYLCDSAYMYNFKAASTSFAGVTANVYIPRGSSRYTSAEQNYGGTLTWVLADEGVCGDNVRWSYDEITQKLVVSGTGAPSDGYFSGNDVPWAGFQDEILSIEVQEGIDYLPSYTFEYCREATSIQLPETLKRIELNTFNNCESLNNLMLPSSLERIGDGNGWDTDFIRCYALTDVYYLGTEADWAKVQNSSKVSSNDSSMTLHFLQKTATTATCTEPGLQAYYTFDDTSVYGSMYDKSYNVITGLSTIPALGHRVIADQDTHIDPLTVTNTSAVPFVLTDGIYYSNNHTGNSSSRIQITARYGCSLTLRYGVSSEQNYDKLYIFYNGIQKAMISGTVSGQTLTLSLAAGDVVTVQYAKDGNVDKNQDRGWVALEYEIVTAEAGEDVPADLTEPDCVEGVVCDYCQSLVVAAPGHREVTDAAVAPTCNASGLTEGKHCDRCGEVTLAQEVVPAGHTAVNGVCTVCGIRVTCGQNLTWRFDQATGILTISGTGEMIDYSEDSGNPAPWTVHAQEITELVIEDGVTTIGNHAFRSCEALTKASLPGSLVEVGDAAFPEGRAAIQVVIDQTVRQWSTVVIGADNVYFPGWNTTSFVNTEPVVASGKAGEHVYWELDESGTMEFFGSGNMYEFGATASPYGELSVKHVNIGEGITNVGMNVFEVWDSAPLAQSLESVTIATTVKTVESMAFVNCKALKTIHFLGDAPAFGENCFSSVVAEAYYPAGNPIWTASVKQNYGGTITWIPEGLVKNRVTLDEADFDGQTSVWIDGKEYAIETEEETRFVDLPDSSAGTLVLYSYHIGDASDVHLQYPVGMKVWTLSNEDGYYTVSRAESLDDILQYSGISIRVTGKKGIRMITSIEREKKNALVSVGLAGLTLKEYGTVVAWVSRLDENNPLVLGQSYAMSNYAYKKAVADPVFAYTGNQMQYTNVLVNFTDEQCKNDIAMRPYMILEDEAGREITLYGGIVCRSIGFIAYQNRNVFEPQTDEYEYIWSIIRYVYGDVYDDEFNYGWSPSIK